MTKATTRGRVEMLLTICTGIVFLLSLAMYASGVPQGASILNNVTEASPTVTPGNRSDDGGTITVLTLDSVQQNNAWKGYVGNVSGRLTLDDASGNTIYDWSLVATAIQGEIYVTRNSTVVWAAISCANGSTISNEQDSMSMVSADSDSINSTFNASNHSLMQVGVNTISANTCQSTATYVNDTRQAGVNSTSEFQEILLQDTSDVMIYATFIDQDSSSYKAGSEINITYDFQLIVAEDDTAGTPTTYYFYMEIS